MKHTRNYIYYYYYFLFIFLLGNVVVCATCDSLPNKHFNTLISKRLRVCDGTILNNLTVTGDLTVYGDSNINLQLLTTATSADIPNTLILRDSTGSFAATTIVLNGTTLIAFNTNPTGSNGQPFIQAPLDGNTIIGLQAAGTGLLTSAYNTVIGYDAGSALTTGTNNIYIGASAGQSHLGNNSIFLGYTQTATGDGLIYIGNPSGVPSSTTTTIYGCINLPEVNPGSGYAASFDVLTGQLVKASSSKKYKDNISSLDDALVTSLYKLRPVEFVFKNSPSYKAFGLLAEEVDALCPDLVIYDDKGEPDSVNYLSLQIVALKALIQQSETINHIERRYNDLLACMFEQQRALEELQEHVEHLLIA